MRNSNRNFFLFWYHFFVFMEVFGGIPIYIMGIYYGATSAPMRLLLSISWSGSRVVCASMMSVHSW